MTSVNVEAEESLIACVIQNGIEAYDHATNALAGLDPMSSQLRRNLWRMFAAMAAAGEMQRGTIPGDHLHSWLLRTPQPIGAHAKAEIGSNLEGQHLAQGKYLAQVDAIFARYSGAHNLDRTCEMLRRLAIDRIVMEELKACINGPENVPPMDRLAKAQLRIEERAQFATLSGGPIDGHALEEIRFQRAERERLSESAKLTWGIGTLDAVMPLRSGRYYVVAGRPSEGKTTLALQALIHNAHAGVAVGFISLESQAADIGDMINKHGIHSHGRDNLWICKRNEMTIAELRVEFRRLHRLGCRLICIDYIQLVEPDDPRMTEYQAVTRASKALMRLGLETGVCVVGIAQMNRGADAPPEEAMPEPKLSDLKGSGSLEQDADGVLFCHRLESKYKAVVQTDLVACKNRQGNTGSVSTFFDKPSGKFIAERDWNDYNRDKKYNQRPNDDEDLFGV